MKPARQPRYQIVSPDCAAITHARLTFDELVDNLKSHDEMMNESTLHDRRDIIIRVVEAEDKI